MATYVSTRRMVKQSSQLQVVSPGVGASGTVWGAQVTVNIPPSALYGILVPSVCTDGGNVTGSGQGAGSGVGIQSYNRTTASLGSNSQFQGLRTVSSLISGTTFFSFFVQNVANLQSAFFSRLISLDGSSTLELNNNNTSAPGVSYVGNFGLLMYNQERVQLAATGYGFGSVPSVTFYFDVWEVY